MATETIVRVGQRGTIVVPAEIRRRWGIRKDTRLILREEGDRLVLMPVPSLTEALAGSAKGCFGSTAAEVREWLDREREDP
ncbi:AbrB/MazE/SpoVT family DNA-binding domain-containing protein [Deferrisoma camini]|uniref:AbrB/MazE/SpoVT family DNA-binding domain-containing protein n=1 Tax=Deferrisoma camini TaxID=1035120 RepID=UPI00046C9D53|nr:AbrB/MazE/SpoVT family DNA-binding domain-containing protein [Deferrisoma camini]